MNGRWLAAGLLLLSGCMMREDTDRIHQAKARQAAELEKVRQQLALSQKEVSQQAAEELEFRKRIAQLNEQFAALREENRNLKDKVAGAERTREATDERIKTLQADHERRLARIKEANDRILAERDARIEQLKARTHQLEALLARSRTSRGNPSTKQVR